MKKYRFLILTMVAAAFVGATVLLWKPITSFAADPEILRSWVSSAGIWGPLVFSALNILQVIFAVIPGAPFEIAAGYLFGVVPGAILCDATMTIGSVLVFLMVRRFGIRFVELFVSREQMEKFPVLSDPRRAALGRCACAGLRAPPGGAAGRLPDVCIQAIGFAGPSALLPTAGRKRIGTAGGHRHRTV